ncbi:MAG: prephenate dehydratase domain-containing protein [Candidatus Paceibacterota bacterium]|jgi:prephenate dehydratase
MKIFALGPQGTNGHEAARKAPMSPLDLLSMRTVEFCSTHEEVFCSVEKDIRTAGVVPIENIIEGHVPDVIDFWTNHPLRSEVCVIGEIHIPIHHQLLVHPSISSVEEITSVVSHPHALGQVRRSLDKFPWITERVPSKSTSLAAQEVASGNIPSRAAIATRFAEQIYNLKNLLEDIGDAEGNETRFHVLGSHRFPPCDTGYDRTAILCVVGNTSGSLSRVISSIGVNISSIKIPIPLGSKDRCGLYLEFDEHFQSKKGKEVMDEIKKTVESVFVLGSYPRERGR